MSSKRRSCATNIFFHPNLPLSKSRHAKAVAAGLSLRCLTEWRCGSRFPRSEQDKFIGAAEGEIADFPPRPPGEILGNRGAVSIWRGCDRARAAFIRLAQSFRSPSPVLAEARFPGFVADEPSTPDLHQRCAAIPLQRAASKHPRSMVSGQMVVPGHRHCQVAAMSVSLRPAVPTASPRAHAFQVTDHAG
jgi:hypothetical protein